MAEIERFFFVHLQKTGGTTLFRRLRNHFGPDAIYPTPEQQARPNSTFDVDHLRDVFERQGDQIKVVTGHFPYCTMDLLGVPFTTLTLLREPLDRTVSLIRRQRDRGPGLAGHSATEIYDRKIWFESFVHNHMVKTFGLTQDLMTNGVLTKVAFNDDFLARAKANLESIDVIGVQEDFDGFCDQLIRLYGWDLGEDHRANESLAPLESLSDALTTRILSDNAMDVELYHHATQLMAERSNQIPC